jgi:Glycosyl transferase family 2
MATLPMLLTASMLLTVAYLAIAAAAAVVAALRAGGRRDDSSEDYDALSVSRFTIPVSIIVPIVEDSSSVSSAIASLLALNYPEVEVIVVASGVAKPTLDTLAREWELEAREFFYRRTLETADVRRIYRSGRDPRLIVIDKAAGGASDALNCGVNVARYRYVMSIAPEVTFDADALLRVMAAALRDPATVVGASNHVERGVSGVGAEAGNAGKARQSAARANGRGARRRDEIGFLGRAGAVFQRLSSARSMMDTRLAWQYLGAGLDPTGAVVVWRRDAVIKLKGFAAAAADADLDMMFRLQTGAAEATGRFDRGVEVFGRVGPRPIRYALWMAWRRQRAALQLLSAAVKGRARMLDARTLAYFVASEFVTPLAQVWLVAATVIGASQGWFGWSCIPLALVLLSFGNAAVSAAALLLRGAVPAAPEETELRSLIIAAPLEFVVYRPALACARFASAISFLLT